MGLAASYKTSESLETKGIILDLGAARVRVARAGGANKKFAKALEKATAPYQAAIQAGSMSEKQANEVLFRVYAQTIVLGWETMDAEPGEDGLPTYSHGIDPEDAGEEGEELLPVNADNVFKVFKNLPELFKKIRVDTASKQLFLANVEKAAGKN